MESILLIIGHFQHNGKEKFSLYSLVIILYRLDIIWNKTNHAFHRHIDPKNIIKIMIVLNRDHDESFLRSNMGRIRDKKSLVPLGVVGVEDGRTESA
jgi:hypothetical protein